MFGDAHLNEPTAALRSSEPGAVNPAPLSSVEDRGHYHAASAMKAMYGMVLPNCSTCVSIMTRNGGCYSYMECGSTGVRS
jgi:ribonucleoside-diphosphate reductase alpha chain